VAISPFSGDFGIFGVFLKFPEKTNPVFEETIRFFCAFKEILGF